MAKVTVLLTSYNHAAFLRQSIESILEQSFRDYELFIVDDGSVDGSADIIKSYHDERIHAFFHDKNQGGPHWERDLKSQMTGEYFAMAHCDDKWLPGKLKKQVEYLDAHPECGACFTDVQVIDENDRPYTEESGFYYDLFSQENRSRFDWLRRFFYEGNCLCHPSLLIRMACYDAYRMSDTESLSSIPDYYQWVRLALHTELYIYPEKLACFRVRQHAANTSGDKPDGHVRSSFEMFKLLSSYLELRDSPEDFLKVFPTARQYLRDGRLCVEYAYARILLDESKMPVFNLLGLLILQNLLDDPEKCALLERDYGYTKLSFMAEAGQKDVFSTVGGEHYMMSSLYWDNGGGFSSMRYALKKHYVNFSEQFEAEFDFPEGLENILRLRFDPDEGVFRTFEHVIVCVDGETFAPCAEGNAEQEGDRVDFYSVDPQFLVQFPEQRTVHKVTVTGITRKIPHEKIEKTMLLQEQKLKKDREQISSLFWTSNGGFCEEQHITQACDIDEDGCFDIVFTFDEPLAGVTGLRIDPDEQTFREYSGIEIAVNGRACFAAVPEKCAVEGGKLFFYTTDPQLLVTLQEPTDIETVRVSGHTRRVPAYEFDARTAQRVQEIQQKAEQSVREMAENLAAARREQEQQSKELQDRYEDKLHAYEREFAARRDYLAHNRLKASVKALLGKLWMD